MKKQESSILKQLYPFIPIKKLLVILLVISPISVVLSYCQPLVLKALTDRGILQQDINLLLTSAGLLLAVSLLSQLLDFLQTKLFAKVYNETYFQLFHTAYQKMLRLKMQYFEKHSPTEIINTIQTDVTSLASVTNSTTNLLLQTGLRIISGLVGGLLISWQLTAAILAIIPLQWFFSSFLAKRKEKAIDQSLARGREFYAWMGDDISGIQEIKLWGLAPGKLQLLIGKLRSLLASYWRNSSLDAVKTFIDGSFLWAASCLIYVLGGIMVIRQRLTMGELLAFIQYSSYVISPLTYLFSIKYSFSSILPSAKRFFCFLALEEEASGGRHLPEDLSKCDLTLRDVTFRYPDSDQDVLTHIDLHIKHGEKIAIIGKNGSGKSTLLKLLLRLSDPTEGTILLDGTAISAYELAEYRALFSVVSQTPHLFAGTILDNIAFGAPLSEETLADLLHKSGADTFVSQLPQRENSAVGVNGAQLSGGERQKLNVARAFVRNAPIVILDEATSAFDVQSVSYLNNLLEHEFKSQTVIVITHQYDLLQHMDHVYQLCDGTLVPLAPSVSGQEGIQEISGPLL